MNFPCGDHHRGGFIQAKRVEQTARYFGGHYSAFVVTKNGRMGGLLFASPVVAAKLHILGTDDRRFYL